MPPTVENRVTLGTAQAPIAAPLDLPDSDEPAQHATHIRILSYNALSLAEEEDLGTSGRRGGNKSGRLDVQFDRRGIHVAGLQESRTREGVSFTEHYKILSSGSQTDNGVNLFGCELWLHRTKAWDCEGQAVTPEHSHCRSHKSPRLLIVRADNASRAGVRQWWTELGLHLMKVPEQAKMCVCIDANATLGQSECEGISSHAAQKANGATPFLEQCMQSFDLSSSPATFADIHKGSTGTWRHPRGTWTRIDYALVSENG